MLKQYLAHSWAGMDSKNPMEKRSVIECQMFMHMDLLDLISKMTLACNVIIGSDDIINLQNHPHQLCG